MLISMHARRKCLLVLSPGIACLLLVSMLLMGCDLPASAQGHTFEGKLSVLQDPKPYILPGQIVLGPDGSLWFPAGVACNTPDQPCGVIEQLTSDGKFHHFPMTTPYTYPIEIAFGHDGKLWFSAFQGNGQLIPMGDQERRFTGGASQLGEMSQDGTFHLFTLPSPAISAHNIAVGPDDNLWFTDVSSASGSDNAYSNKIGRVTPSGVFTEFPLTLRKGTDFIDHLIAGPDGNLWFSIDSELPDYSVFGEMGRMTPQGTVAIFDLGRFAEPRDMTIGPDNNLWFSDGHNIGRITMDGKVRIFKTDPGNKVQTSGITSNSDGAIWFATLNSEVGRVTTDGAFKFYPLPPETHFDEGASSLDMGHLRGIVSGADGTLWLTNDDRIGHFV
ncbi:MAG TPA: hypothetical protein VKR06_04360 [Ktedonosporobacter sp.]|nr:hypothetical protein [Ktedonosporobacter sp.]